MKQLPRWLVFSFIIIAFIGFLDASYLTVKNLTGDSITCTLTDGCDEVTNSEYSQLFGIPVALLGMLYYLSVLILSLLYFDTKNPKLGKLILPLTCVGLLASAWFVYAQIFLIKAICQYCMVSALTSSTLFILGLITLKYYGKKN